MCPITPLPREENQGRLQIGNCDKASFPDDYFRSGFLDHDLAQPAQLRTLIRRCVRWSASANGISLRRSYRNESEKANLLYWQVTCELFGTPEEWIGGSSKQVIPAIIR